MKQKSEPGAHDRYREVLHQLRIVVREADCLLTDAVLVVLQSVHEALLAGPDRREELLGLAPEYGRLEFLACVDEAGSIVPASSSALERLRSMAEKHPDMSLWFNLEERAQPDRAFILPARWLCHLAGFRHRTVQLFLDHPKSRHHTLAQVRGLNRPESPGCFDMPAAGHVVGMMSADHALLKELGEELGLRPEDLDDLRELGNYVYFDPPGAAFCGVEHRTTYRGRLREGALERISFPDGEVAGIAILSVPHLAELIQSHTERVASGLAASARLYPGLNGKAPH